MSTSVFSSIGDDPVIAPDILDPAITGASDPFSETTAPADPTAYNAPIYGPSLSQLGLTADSAPALGDPSAFNSNPTTAAPAGSSVWDTLLGVSKLAVAGAQVAGAIQGNAANPLPNQKKVATAKTTSGTGSGSLLLIVLLFVGVFLFLEFKH